MKDTFLKQQTQYLGNGAGYPGKVPHSFGHWTLLHFGIFSLKSRIRAPSGSRVLTDCLTLWWNREEMWVLKQGNQEYLLRNLS